METIVRVEGWNVVLTAKGWKSENKEIERKCAFVVRCGLGGYFYSPNPHESRADMLVDGLTSIGLQANIVSIDPDARRAKYYPGSSRH